MRCPHCLENFHDQWRTLLYPPPALHSGTVRWTVKFCNCAGCHKDIIKILSHADSDEFLAYPKNATGRKEPPAEVPQEIASDYREACAVLPLSAKASAALARRCLQNVLHQFGYKARDLAAEIDFVLNEPDPKKAISSSLRTTIDMIRHYGNFSAHPVNDKITLQVIEVQDGEADYCLDVLEAVFDDFYVKPAAAKRRVDAANAKLASAGKQPVKG